MFPKFSNSVEITLDEIFSNCHCFVGAFRAPNREAAHHLVARYSSEFRLKLHVLDFSGFDFPPLWFSSVIDATKRRKVELCKPAYQNNEAQSQGYYVFHDRIYKLFMYKNAGLYSDKQGV